MDISIWLLIVSFASGILTVLAPCVLPLLPVIIGGSLSQFDKHAKYQPHIITASLAISITLFTLFLKASSLLIDIDPVIWKYISGMLVLCFGLTYIFPNAWSNLLVMLKISGKSDKLLDKAYEKQGITKSILIGASLGPVFASCSPTYALIIATVLPVNFVIGSIYIIMYAIGLALVMLLIALLGRSFIKKLKVFANPNSIFKKILGLMFVLVGFAIISGFDKKIETLVLNSGFIDITKVEEKLLNSTSATSTSTLNLNSGNLTQGSNHHELFNINIDDKILAPELVGIKDWINTGNNAVTLASLKGKVVLLDFWTYSCINCQRTLPYITKWYDTYKDKGLVVLGVHAPEFSFEKNKANVEKFVQENNVHYPVGLDNDFATWRSYNNKYWPAHYLIDKDGILRRTHFGEGDYEQSEMAIVELLKERNNSIDNISLVSTVISNENAKNTSANSDVAQSNHKLTPETYIGYDRLDKFANISELHKDKNANYTVQNSLNSDYWSIDGAWNVDAEKATTIKNGANFKMKFNAKNVYIVMSGNGVAEVNINKSSTIFNGKDVDTNGKLHINGPRLYTIVNAKKYIENGELAIKLPNGISLNAITFG
jgi:cytochrome c biogenesis protein CcdA/thiol-disulfide isomerase/thioredoxin